MKSTPGKLWFLSLYIYKPAKVNDIFFYMDRNVDSQTQNNNSPY